MMHTCAWCGHAAESSAPPTLPEKSHGICAECLAEMLAEVFNVGGTKEKKSVPLPQRFDQACDVV